MGSWSESCGFSGLEIGDGEVAYVLLMSNSKHGSLNDGAFINYSPVTTLVRGTYNDYGYLKVEEDEKVLAIFNDQAKLELKNGDDFSLDMLDGRADVRRWWIHGSMFDALPSLKPEFPYFSSRLGGYTSVKIKNIGESADKRIAEIRTAYQAGRIEFAQRVAKLTGTESVELIEAISCLSKFSLRELFGYGERDGYGARFQEALKANVEDVEDLIEAYRRTYVLGYSLTELRKTLAPNESCGPQHGGEVALDQFAVALRRILRERKKRWDG
jgi:hypothetical protein